MGPALGGRTIGLFLDQNCRVLALVVEDVGIRGSSRGFHLICLSVTFVKNREEGEISLQVGTWSFSSCPGEQANVEGGNSKLLKLYKYVLPGLDLM